jgi:plasmid stabilization system protein ParE
MSQISWLEQAINDIQRHIEILNAQCSGRGDDFAEAVANAGHSLTTFPKRYPLVQPNSVIRKMPVPFGKYGYCLFYIVSDDNVLIVQILHAREPSPY